jgi:hypothetical protein
MTEFTTWKYLNTGDRDAMLIFTNLCISNGAITYYNTLAEPPTINIAASAKSMDVRLPYSSGGSKSPSNIKLIDRPLFVMGGVWPYHFSHFFLNNFLPLVNVMNNYYGGYGWMAYERDLYLYGQNEFFDISSWNFTNVYGNNRESRQVKSDTGVICYKTAIVGLNNTCDCCGCVKDFPDKYVYKQMRNMVFQTHLKRLPISTPAYKLPLKIIVIERLSSRGIINLAELEAFLKRKYDYQIVNLEYLSFTEQLELFSTATVLIGSHGNGLGNAFWMPPGSVVIELHSWKQGSAWFEHWFSDAAAGHYIQYNVVKCLDESCSDNHESSFNSKTYANITQIGQILQKFQSIQV